CAPPGLQPVHDSLGTPEGRRSRAGFAPRFCTSSWKRVLPLHGGTNLIVSPPSGVRSGLGRGAARSTASPVHSRAALLAEFAPVFSSVLGFGAFADGVIA